MSSEVKANKVSPASGTNFTFGDSGDTFTIPSGATIANSGTATGFGDDNTPAFQARMSTGQSLSASGWFKLQVDTEVFDTDGAYDHSTNYRFTVPSGEAGTYIFWFGTQFNGVATGVATNTVLYVNGSFELRSRTANGYIQHAGVGHHNHLDSSMMELDVGDYVELYALQHGSGAATAQYEETYFGGMKVAGTS